MGKPVGVGIIGTGAISAQYLATIDNLDELRLVAVADLDLTRAQAIADAREGVRALSVDELLADPEVEAVLNLTIPAAHAEVALAAIAAGKTVYNEKPLAATTEAARGLLEAAAEAGILLGGAPDTVLGTGVQTARAAIDAGLIGTPTAATGTFLCAGHERWHPNPDFYYVPGGGPMLDMGPYYVTSLVTLLGPVASVIGASSRPRDTRRINSGPREGEEIPVSTDTHVTCILTHASGAISTVTLSFDVVATEAKPLEVHGPLGSMSVPDPNYFAGDVRVKLLGEAEWKVVPTSAGWRHGGRGIGLADLVASGATDGEIADGGPRASGALALHVLEVMESVLISAKEGRAIEITSTVERPAALPLTGPEEAPASA